MIDGILNFLCVAFSLFVFFAASAASSAAGAAAFAGASAVDAAIITAAVAAAEPALQYLQGAGIRTRDSATADRCAINELQSPLKFTLSFILILKFNLQETFETKEVLAFSILNFLPSYFLKIS